MRRNCTRIRRLWRTERQDWDDSVPRIFREVHRYDLEWPTDDNGQFDGNHKDILAGICNEYGAPVDLVAKLLEAERSASGRARRSSIQKSLERILAQVWRSEEEIVAEEEWQLRLTSAPMRFLQLAVQNLGVFKDYHYFDLAPTQGPEGNGHALTVVSGANGVGKSTLFQALLLALYGQLAAGDRLSRQAYSEFLLSRLHRYHVDGVPITCDQASVVLTLQYVESGTQFPPRHRASVGA